MITLPEKAGAENLEGELLSKYADVLDQARHLGPGAPDGRRILVLGCAPLPFENQRMNLAPGMRTWQFAKALADDGHAVCVVAARIPGAFSTELGSEVRLEEPGVLVWTLDPEVFRQPGCLEGMVGAFRPDAIIGASSSLPALKAVEIAGERPVWVDLFGDLMAEAQARAEVHPEEDLLAHRDALVTLLDRGDMFSAVSERQRFSVIGQLGLVGRLNSRVQTGDLVHSVPCAVVSEFASPSDGAQTAVAEMFDEEDFVLLWSGGFNTWCDVDTLLDGVEKAMSRSSRLQLVVTGGAIPGHDDRTFPRFVHRVEASEFRDRIHVKGQIESCELAAFLRRADLGIVTEKSRVERLLGSSGRILHWLAEGLPLVCTDLSELGATLAAENLVSVYRPGDADDLCRAILEVVSEPEATRERAGRARVFAGDRWSVEATMAPVREWVTRCRRAADAGVPNPLSMAEGVDLSLLEAEKVKLHEVREELGKIHHSRMWKVWMFYLGLPRFFRLGRKAESQSERLNDVE